MSDLEGLGTSLGRRSIKVVVEESLLSAVNGIVIDPWRVALWFSMQRRGEGGPMSMSMWGEYQVGRRGEGGTHVG